MASEIEALGNEPDSDTETAEHTLWLEQVRAVRVHRWHELTLYMQKDGCWEPLVKAIIEELETNMADWESIKFWCRAWLRMLDKYDDGSQLLAMSGVAIDGTPAAEIAGRPVEYKLGRSDAQASASRGRQPHRARVRELSR